jgi:hypothetical protein
VLVGIIVMAVPEALWAAVEFNGSNQYASIADNNLLTPSKWAISFWLKQDVGASRAVYSHRAGASSRIEIFSNANGSNWTVTVSTGSTSKDLIVNGGTHIGQWHRWVAAWDGAQISLYKDGALLGSPLAFSGSQHNVAASAYIGSRGGTSSFMDGQIAELAIWDLNQVTLASVVSASAGSLTAPQAGLKVLWRLNNFANGVIASGAGSLLDSGGSGLHATPVNSPIGRGNDPFQGDTIPPTGTVTINGGATATNSVNVTLTLSATDSSGVADMQFSNDNVTYAAPIAYATSAPWTLTSGDGSKTVWAKFKDTAGNESTPVSDAITLDTTSPTVTITSPQDGAVLEAPVP